MQGPQASGGCRPAQKEGRAGGLLSGVHGQGHPRLPERQHPCRCRTSSGTMTLSCSSGMPSRLSSARVWWLMMQCLIWPVLRSVLSGHSSLYFSPFRTCICSRVCVRSAAAAAARRQAGADEEGGRPRAALQALYGSGVAHAPHERQPLLLPAGGMCVHGIGVRGAGALACTRAEVGT